LIAATQQKVNRIRQLRPGAWRRPLRLNVDGQNARFGADIEGADCVTDIADAAERKTGQLAILGWMMFDWAAQPFFTVVLTFVFGPYFAARMATDPSAGALAWSNVGTVSSILIALVSPVLGAVADATGNRKRWIGVFAVVKIAALMALWTAAPGSSLLGIGILVILASLAAEFSIVFNDSMMPRLIGSAEIGKISNIAWGLGYLGGLIALFFVLLCLAGNPQTGKTIIGITPLFGLDPAQGEDARITGPFAALWYLIFVLPMFLFTPDTTRGEKLLPAIRQGLGELGETLRRLRHRPGLMRFLIARMLYQDGVGGLLFLGGAFAAGMFGWGTTEIGLYGIMLALVAVFGCLIAGYLDSALGSKRVVVGSLVILVAATIGNISTTPTSTLFGLVDLAPTAGTGLFSSAAERCYILYGVLIGLAFGPVQASSRSFFARSVEVEEAGRYFGIYALSGRATAFMATGVNGLLIALTGSPRIGMASLIFFFIAGLILLIVTPYPARDPE
jgi:UMF1 family MFS transporter